MQAPFFILWYWNHPANGKKENIYEKTHIGSNVIPVYDAGISADLVRSRG